MKNIILSFALLTYFAANIYAGNNDVYNQLEDAIELNNTVLIQEKIELGNKNNENTGSHIQRLRMGILYYQAAMNAPRTNKETLVLIEKAYTLLTILKNDKNTNLQLQPFVDGYQAATLAILGYYHDNTGLIHQAFSFFDLAVQKYDENSFVPRYLRAKTAQHLPTYYAKKNLARRDFDVLLGRTTENQKFAPAKITGYICCYWADLHNIKKFRTKALQCLQKAIDSDPDGHAAGPMAKKIMAKYNLTDQKMTAGR